MIRGWIAAVAVVATEVMLYIQYSQFDGEFHYWLHGLLGAALGLAVQTAARLIARRPGATGSTISWRLTPWEAALLGHVYSVLPDFLFLAADIPHYRWMDVFGFHITAHFIPAAILTALAVFLLTLAGYGLAMIGHRRTTVAGVGALAAAALVTAYALVIAAPIPSDVQDLRARTGLTGQQAEHR